jgi:hypothetical protein
MERLAHDVLVHIFSKVSDIGVLDHLMTVSKSFRRAIMDRRENILLAWLASMSFADSQILRTPYDAQWFCESDDEYACAFLEKMQDRGQEVLAPPGATPSMEPSVEHSVFWSSYRLVLFQRALRCNHVRAARRIMGNLKSWKCLADAAYANLENALSIPAKTCVDDLMLERLGGSKPEELHRHQDFFIRIICLVEARKSFLRLISLLPNAAARIIEMLYTSRIAAAAWPQVQRPEFLIMCAFVEHVLLTRTHAECADFHPDALRQFYILEKHIVDKLGRVDIDVYYQAAVISVNGILRQWRSHVAAMQLPELEYPQTTIRRCHAIINDLMLYRMEPERRRCMGSHIRSSNLFTWFFSTGRVQQALSLLATFTDLEPVVDVDFLMDTVPREGFLACFCSSKLTRDDVAVLKCAFPFASDWSAWNRLLCRLATALQHHASEQHNRRSMCHPWRIVPYSTKIASENLKQLVPKHADCAAASMEYLLQGHVHSRMWMVRGLLFRMGILSLKTFASTLSTTHYYRHAVFDPLVLMTLSTGMLDERSSVQMSAVWTLCIARQQAVQHQLRYQRKLDLMLLRYPLHVACVLAFRMDHPDALEEFLQQLSSSRREAASSSRQLSAVEVELLFSALNRCFVEIVCVLLPNWQRVSTQQTHLTIGLSELEQLHRRHPPQTEWMDEEDRVAFNEALTRWCRLVCMACGTLVHYDEYRVLKGMVHIAILLEKRSMRTLSNCMMTQANHLAAQVRGWSVPLASYIIRSIIFDLWHTL